MKILTSVTAAIALLFIFFQCQTQPHADAPTAPKAVIGYVGGFRGAIDETTIDAAKLTHINYAFVNVQDSLAVLTNLSTDSTNFRKLNTLKSINPGLKILISLGGWSWSENFSDAVLTPGSREKFAASCVDIVRTYDLDGVDIDWEYPSVPGEEGNVVRPEDKENFTLMFKVIREHLGRLTAATGKTYLLTTAVPIFQKFLDMNDLAAAAQYLDLVNLMTYDFFVNGDTAGHHTNLYPSENYDSEESAHKGVEAYKKAGVPAEKLVIGIAFYGRSWYMRSADNRGVNRPVDSLARAGGYTYIKDSILTRPGVVRYWDEKAQAAYAFNEQNNQFFTFDDEESVKAKCRYVKEKGLAGVMFWEYRSDPKLYLLHAIHQNIR